MGKHAIQSHDHIPPTTQDREPRELVTQRHVSSLEDRKHLVRKEGRTHERKRNIQKAPSRLHLYANPFFLSDCFRSSELDTWRGPVARADWHPSAFPSAASKSGGTGDGNQKRQRKRNRSTSKLSLDFGGTFVLARPQRKVERIGQRKVRG